MSSDFFVLQAFAVADEGTRLVWRDKRAIDQLRRVQAELDRVNLE